MERSSLNYTQSRVAKSGFLHIIVLIVTISAGCFYSMWVKGLHNAHMIFELNASIEIFYQFNILPVIKLC